MWSTASQHGDPLAWRFYGAEAVWRFSHRIEADLPALAADAMSGGFDSPAVVLLAGELRTAVQADLGDLLVRAARELGIPEPSLDELPERVLQYRSWRQIVEGDLGRVEGALSITRLIHAEPQPSATFEFSLDEDRSRGCVSEDQAFLERRIRDAALAALASLPRAPRLGQ